VEAGVDGNCHNRMSVKKSALADLQFLINPYPGKPFIHLQFVVEYENSYDPPFCFPSLEHEILGSALH